MKLEARVIGALVASLGMHVTFMLGLPALRAPSAPRAQPASATGPDWVAFSVEPAGTDGALHYNQRAPALVLGGPHSHSAIDQAVPEGRGAPGAERDPGARLFPFVSSVTLQDSDLNNVAVNQAQRIRTADERATLEQRRASPNAADEVFLASGQRGHPERRPHRKRDAMTGARYGTRPSSAAQAPAAVPSAELLPPEREAAVTAQSALGQAEVAQAPANPAETASQDEPGNVDQVGRGIARGTGTYPSEAANVAFARPNVDRGPAATTAELQDARVRDSRDAELLAARLARSIVDSSVQPSPRTGTGSGGDGDKHSTAVGYRGEGSGARALPYLPGPGAHGALDTADGRYLRWVLSQRARVQQELVFPFARAIAKDQGTSVYRVEVGRDGRLRGAPTLVRSSGFSDFDAAAVAAIQKAAPFEPLPPALAPDQDRLSLLIPVAFSNPMVD